MLIRPLSDLHLEHQPWVPSRIQSDVVILAGDVHSGMHGIPWIKKHFGDSHVIYVMGNHEWYGHSIPATLKKWKQLAMRHGIFILNNDEIIIDNSLRILGTTLWTDFRVTGEQECAMEIAKRKVWDYEAIKWSEFRGIFRALTPKDILSLHEESLEWLTKRINVPFKGKTVVVTHHAPHPNSLNRVRYKGNAHDPYYATDLTHLMDGDKVHLWIHGHTHAPMDYMINGTRVLSNPRGYPGEKTSFSDGMLINV